MLLHEQVLPQEVWNRTILINVLEKLYEHLAAHFVGVLNLPGARGRLDNRGRQISEHLVSTFLHVEASFQVKFHVFDGAFKHL